MWEYFAAQATRDIEELNDLLESMAYQGWELVNGAAATDIWMTINPHSGKYEPASKIIYTTFWRRQVNSEAAHLSAVLAAIAGASSATSSRPDQSYMGDGPLVSVEG